MANRVLDVRKSDFFNIRYKQIQNYEEYLYENSYRLLKIFLHVSKDTQRKRFLERIDKKEKNGSSTLTICATENCLTKL